MDKVGRMWTKVGKGGGRWLKVDENIRGATCTSDAIFPPWLGLDTAWLGHISSNHEVSFYGN